jgi:MFS family permease
MRTLPFLTGSAILFATGVMLLFLRAPGAQPAEEPGATDPLERRADRRHRFFLVSAWSGLFVAYVGVGCARSLFNKLAAEVELKNELVGAIYGIGLIAQTISMWSMGRFGGWHYRKRVIPLAEIGLAAAALTIALGRAPYMFALGHMILGASMAVLYSASLYYSMQDPADAHRNAAVHEAIIGSAQMSPLVLGVIADYFRFTPLSFYNAAALALCLCIVHTVASRLAHAQGILAVEPPLAVREEAS